MPESGLVDARPRQHGANQACDRGESANSSECEENSGNVFAALVTVAFFAGPGFGLAAACRMCTLRAPLRKTKHCFPANVHGCGSAG
jgi:hypothetical protein